MAKALHRTKRFIQNSVSSIQMPILDCERTHTDKKREESVRYMVFCIHYMVQCLADPIDLTSKFMLLKMNQHQRKLSQIPNGIGLI